MSPTKVKRVQQLTPEQTAMLPAWRDKWIEIGLRTGPADRAAFERHVRVCYRTAGLVEPKRIVWVPSPFVLSFAAPAAALSLEWRDRITKTPSLRAELLRGLPPGVRGAVDGAVRGAVDGAVGGAVVGAVDVAVVGAVVGAVGGAVVGAVDGAVDGAVGVAVDGAVGGAVDGAVGGAVDGAVGGAVRGAVDGAVVGAVDGAVRGAVDGAVRGAVDGAVRGAVDGAVGGAVGGAVDGAVGVAVDVAVGVAVVGAVRGAVRGAVVRAIDRGWYCRIGGQLWSGWVAWRSFFVDVCNLDIGEELHARAVAYAGTVESACWWWPHRDFVMVCERPLEIHRDASGRLHNPFGPAIVWPDGWGVHAIHGVRVPANVIDEPQSVTVATIDAEQNAEVRRVMVERYGRDKYIRECGAKLVHEDTDQHGRPRRLWRREWRDGRVLQMVEVVNSSAEPDGSRKSYFLQVHPELRPIHRSKPLGEPQPLTCHNAVASTFYRRGEEYAPELET
jgi:hypothetical protein